MKKKNVVGVRSIVVVLIIAALAGGFWYYNGLGNNENTGESIEVLKQEKDLVWYEIPEMNIKFLVEKEIAEVILYRDFYVQDSKDKGKELYVQGVDSSFGEILIYNKMDVRNPRYATTQVPVWNTICSGENSRILFKNGEKILCYNDLNKIVDVNSRIIEKIFNNYLSAVNVELINK